MRPPVAAWGLALAATGGFHARVRSTTPHLPAAAPSRWSARRRAVVAALAVASTVLVGFGAAAPAEAAGTKHPRVIAVGASSSYLLYRQKTATAAGLLITKGSALSFIGRSGGRHALKDFDPQLFPTIQGSTVTQSAEPNSRYGDAYDAALPEHVRWHDLRSGAKGVTEIPATDDYVAAAPGGWIATRTAEPGSPARVIRWSTSGKAVDLGTPVVGSSLFRLVPGPSGVVAYSRNDTGLDGTGLIRYLSYRTPGVWRTVYAAGTGIDTFCPRASASAVLCDIDAGTKRHSGTVLLSLTSSKRVWLSDHPKTCQVIAFTVVGSRAIGKATSDQGRCVDGRLTQLAASGTVTQSTRLWGPHASGIVDGLGRILLDTGDQRRIVALTSLRATPQTVVTAH